MSVWSVFLTTQRLRQSSNLDAKAKDHSDFHRDFDRVVFSSYFRSLQQKTQVIPFPKTDFVHSRLTHSLETASVGKSLGISFAKIVAQNHLDFQKEINDLGVEFADFGAIVSAAALAHDIGNPPFGHAGEDTIRTFFQANKSNYLSTLTEEEQFDFLFFEGNAAGFRILTHTPENVSKLKGGLNLTFATLAAFTKYPCLAKESALVNKQIKKSVETKKFGVFSSEKETAKQVFHSCGMAKRQTKGMDGFFRHPLAFLTEAADDICYQIIDLEDAARLGWVSLQQVENYLKPFLKGEAEKSYQLIDEKFEKLSYLRANAINTLIHQVTQTALFSYPEMITGKLSESLTARMPEKELFGEIQKFSVQSIYQHPTVTENEIAGHSVLMGLLELFVPAALSPIEGINKAIMRLVPDRYKGKNTTYDKLMGIVDFIGGLSDKAALLLFQQLKGLN